MNKKSKQARTRLAFLPHHGRTLPAKVIRALADEELSRASGAMTAGHENPTYDITFPRDPDGLAKNDVVD